MTNNEYIASILALANEAVRIKDNKPYFFDRNKTVPPCNSLKNADGNSPDSAETLTAENPLSEGIFQNCAIMVFDGTLPDFFFSLFGKRWKSSLTSILTLVELFKNRTSTKEITVLYLPTRCKYLTDIFGNHQHVSRTIQRCLKIGLLKCVNDKFRFGEYNSYSKQYAWNKKAERLILDYCKECGIKASIPHSVTMKWAIDHFGENDGWKIKAEGLNIDIVPQTNLPKELTNEEVVEAILVRYPQIKDAMVTAIRLNKNLPEEEQISVVPTIQRSTKSGRITKIGFRITNPIVSAKVHDNQNDDYHGIWLKRDVLEPKFGKWAEYDVKGSIYRVAHFLSFHEWLPDTVDPYEEMAGFKFNTKEERNHFKYLSMQLYFENSAASQLNHYVLKGLGKSFQDKNYIIPVIEEARWRQRQFCGESLRSKIFIAESVIYLEAFRRMVEEKGWRVIQVYDGFYIENGDENTVKEAARIVRESACWYAEKYLGWKPVEALEAPSAVVPVYPTEKPVERAEDPAEVKESTEEEVRARLYASNTKKMDLSRWQEQLDSWQKANGVATKPIDPTSLVDIGGKVAEAFGASFGVSQTKTWRDASPDDLKRWNETLNPSTGSTKSWKEVSSDYLKRWQREIQEESDTKVNWSSDETAARLELWMLDA